MLRKDGSEFPAEVQASFVLDGAGAPTGLRLVARDLTLRLTAEQERLALIGSAAPDLIAILDRHLKITFANEAHRWILGKEPASFIGRAVAELVHPEDGAMFREAMVKGKGLAQGTVIRLAHTEGRWVPVELSVQQVSTAEGEFDGVVAAGRDISDRLATQAALVASEERLRAVLDASPDLISIMDRDGTVHFANPAHARLLNRPPETLVGKNALVLVHPDDLAAATTSLAQLYERPMETELIVRLQHGDGHYVTFEVAAQAIRGPAGEVAGLVVTSRDVTERLRREDALRLSEERFSRAFDGSPMAMALIDFDSGHMLDVNERWVQLFCLSWEQVLGRSPGELRIWVDQEERLRLGEQLRSTGIVSDMEVRIRRPDGSGRNVVTSASTVEMGGRRVVIASYGDVTEQRKAEAEHRLFESQMQESQRLESLGLLAGGVAHDFNNLLMAIMGNTSLALMETETGTNTEEYLREIELATQRAADLARQMLAYAGRGRLVMAPLDLSELSGEMSRILAVSIARKARLSWHLASRALVVEGDATQLRQVITNLVINASEAIGDDEGSITIETGLMNADAGYLSEAMLAPDLPGGEYAYVEVRDTGCGMDEGTIRRMFDPFFTTKFTGRGLGMAAVLGIIRGHRGAIRVASAPGEGTAIRVLLPRVNAGAAASSSTNAESGMEEGKGTVVVIDDNDAIRKVTTRLLERQGFRVVVAENAGGGLNQLRLLKGEELAALVDIGDGNGAGLEAVRALRSERPGLPVVLVGGGLPGEWDRETDGDPPVQVQKPFSGQQLAAAMREARGGR